MEQPENKPSFMSTNQILQHPSHQHPLKLREKFINENRNPTCRLCRSNIWSNAYYICQEGCNTDSYSYHRACVEVPARIDRHPLHPQHPLTLSQDRPFSCDGCYDYFISDNSSFRCDECDFDLHMVCALLDIQGSQGGKTSEQITLPFHIHPLTPFSTWHEFVGDRDCYICQESVQEDGYLCTQWSCDFIIHKTCVQDLYYADGTKAPRVYHGHTMEILVGEEDSGSTTCARCGSDKSGEFIGCESCGVFYHRNCFQVSEIITYPSHDPDHTLVFFPDIGSGRECQSCSGYSKDQIYYRCDSCDFFVHVGCASQVLAYCEKGMSGKIKLSWHKHPLSLCHRMESASNCCKHCGDQSNGPTYVCEEKGCGFLLHKRCTEIESTITHPHHPDHPLILGEKDDFYYDCHVCGVTDHGLMFFCDLCLVFLHVECAALFPTHKHYLHEHNLLRLERCEGARCNRCGKSTALPIFRCVPCKFNLHEECMDLPRVVKSKIHWHPLTLQKTFVEDDSGEYYCEECEQTRDPRMGVYVCGQCEISIPRIYHIHCVLPELAKVYVKDYRKESLVSAVEKLNADIADKKEKLEEAKRELDEMEKERVRLLDQIKRR